MTQFVGWVSEWVCVLYDFAVGSVGLFYRHQLNFIYFQIFHVLYIETCHQFSFPFTLLKNLFFFELKFKTNLIIQVSVFILVFNLFSIFFVWPNFYASFRLIGCFASASSVSSSSSQPPSSPSPSHLPFCSCFHTRISRAHTPTRPPLLLPFLTSTWLIFVNCKRHRLATNYVFCFVSFVRSFVRVLHQDRGAANLINSCLAPLSLSPASFVLFFVRPEPTHLHRRSSSSRPYSNKRTNRAHQTVRQRHKIQFGMHRMKKKWKTKMAADFDEGGV